jgi:hypothetical protein
MIPPILPQDGILGQVAGINSISLLASNIRLAIQPD